MQLPTTSLHKVRTAIAGAGIVALTLAPAGQAIAASSWNPTLLVNTESFQLIDAGDGSTNIELQFGANTKTLKFLTTNKFQFSHPLSVIGNLSGSSLTVDNLRSCDSIDTDAAGNLVCGTDAGGISQTSGDARYVNTSGDTMTGSLKVRGGLSGTTLHVDGNADVFGTFSATGAIKTRSDITINADNDTNDATLTFGNQSAAQTLKFLNTAQKFSFSKDVRVIGNISGSTLQVDGASTFNGTATHNANVKVRGSLSGTTLTVDDGVSINGVNYNFQGTQGSSNTFLKNDGAGNLTWSSATIGNSSGNILALSPEYPNAAYAASGSSTVGQLTYSGALGSDNLYRWTTTKGTLQSYMIAVRLQVPKNFAHWETASGIQLRVRTGTTSAADNHVTFRVLDTAGATVATGNSSSLTSNTAGAWRTNTITGLSSGTYTPLGFITLLIKVAATSAGYADVGYTTVRWTTSTP